MTIPKTELEEVRDMLRGALADKLVLETKLAHANSALLETEHRNAELHAEVVKLRSEKQYIWGRLLEGGDDAPSVAARDAEWRAAVDLVRREVQGTRSANIHNAALDTLLAAMEAK